MAQHPIDTRDRRPAAAQEPLDFSDAARLREHLVRCGLAEVQAGLAALILAEGETKVTEEKIYRLLRISSRHAAGKLRCRPSSVGRSAERLEQMGLIRIARDRAGRPPVYVLDVLAARSAATRDQRLEELVREETVKAPRGVAWCSVAPRGVASVAPCNEEINKNSLSGPCSLQSTAQGETKEADATGRDTGRHRGAPLRPLPERPWSRADGMSNAQIEAAVAAGDLVWWEHAYRELLKFRRGWLAEGRADDPQTGHDRWLRFLAIAHHAATTQCKVRRHVMGRRIKDGLDVRKTRHASDDWAAAQLGRRWRDPDLAGRMMADWE